MREWKIILERKSCPYLVGTIKCHLRGGPIDCNIKDCSLKYDWIHTYIDPKIMRV